MKIEEEKKLLAITLAASYLGVCEHSLRTWANEGRIPCYTTPGGHRRFKVSDLTEFLKKSEKYYGESRKNPNTVAKRGISDG